MISLSFAYISKAPKELRQNEGSNAGHLSIYICSQTIGHSRGRAANVYITEWVGLAQVCSNSCKVHTHFSVSVERWCRLRGNLLFYFKSRDHWSEPAGVIVVEDCQVKAEAAAPLDDSTFGLVLAFGGGQFQHLATYTEAERDSWMAALRSASHRHMKAHLEELRARLNAKTSVAAIAKPEAAAVASNEFFPVIGKD